MLREDERVKEYIPVNTLDESIYHVFENGIVLCRLIKQLDANAVDESKINTNKGINTFQARINIDVSLNAAKSLGIKLPGISSENFLNHDSKGILITLWAIIK